MIEAKVQTIGSEAINEENLLILFNDTATAALKNYSIIQAVQGEPVFDLQKFGKITFDEAEYQIEHIGSMANQNLTDINHVTLIFDEVPASDFIENGIYLTPYKLPKIKEGTVIRYS
ncbi:PTS system glucitol/sorbitol-specific IIA component [Enterococcus sp. PF1-24]|uniref:PTS glucitol/sorbitol transporter subunit IIA n=1 Tax=unclassified Enterococcus TaxID=2608891 RepID=UPI0024768E85|nr:MULTISPECIES: PTS glucitol/sorbitol transporter subunit IIA [unclassified Enterococcus]MDH6365735.1 PTS system glucitol/sorbitol-specific IIA component [Enterococcus sp. PFB1-1]MDH6402842.1 PTS system glucitol/sorbitol-specific IIA component [Enterococcus sp. PF1-24]